MELAELEALRLIDERLEKPGGDRVLIFGEREVGVEKFGPCLKFFGKRFDRGESLACVGNFFRIDQDFHFAQQEFGRLRWVDGIFQSRKCGECGIALADRELQVGEACCRFITVRGIWFFHQRGELCDRIGDATDGCEGLTFPKRLLRVLACDRLLEQVEGRSGFAGADPCFGQADGRAGILLGLELGTLQAAVVVKCGNFPKSCGERLIALAHVVLRALTAGGGAGKREHEWQNRPQMHFVARILASVLGCGQSG